MPFIDIAAFLAWLLPIIQTYGALSVFVGFFLEEVIIPIPSPLIAMAAGFILIPATATLDQALGVAFFTIMIPGAVAMTIGSLIIYAVAYYGGERIVNRFERFFGTTVADIEKTTRKIEKSKRIWITIAVLRIIFVVPTSIVSLASGFMRLNWKKFTISTFIGALPRIFILSLIGWQLGTAYITIAENFSSIENLLFYTIGGLIIIGAAFFVYRKKHKITRRKKKK
jgi:membrane protein DedA with SNARE-associated domain